MIYMFVDNIFRKEILNNLEKNIFYKRLSEVENEDKDSEIFLILIYKNESEIKDLSYQNIKKDKINFYVIKRTSSKMI